MTNKQIIIDGVDVSGCEKYKDYTLCCSRTPNCNYKKYKRKEQEYEELRKYHNKCCEEFEKEKKEWLEKYNQVSRDFCRGKYCNAEKCQQLDQLKAENDELKRANLHIENNREHKANKLNRIEKLILACTTGYTDEFIQELLVILHEPEPSSFENKYKQILTEIKEIAENAAKCLYVTKSNDYTDGYRWLGSIILQKISEVENV